MENQSSRSSYQQEQQNYPQYQNEQQNYPQYQAQKQLDMQVLRRFQDQKLSNENMANLIATIETAGKKYRNEDLSTRQFGYFDSMKFGEKKSLAEIISQANTQCRIFFESFKIFTEDHGSYDFPGNMSQSVIISFVKQYDDVPELELCIQNFILIIENKLDKVEFPSRVPSSDSKQMNFTQDHMHAFMATRAGTDKMCEDVQNTYEANPDSVKSDLKFNSDAVHPITQSLEKIESGSEMENPKSDVMQEEETEAGEMSISNKVIC